jgi:hypothetical protein
MIYNSLSSTLRRALIRLHVSDAGSILPRPQRQPPNKLFDVSRTRQIISWANAPLNVSGAYSVPSGSLSGDWALNYCCMSRSRVHLADRVTTNRLPTWEPANQDAVIVREIAQQIDEEVALQGSANIGAFAHDHDGDITV